MAWNATIPARILRVNHGGETGAILIYRAQIAVARWRALDLRPFLLEALAHEREHQAKFRDLMPARESKPCRAMWIWILGGTGLGVVSALLGREAILACTAAVERTVHRHLNDQIAWTEMRDPELHDTLKAIQVEEMAHLEYATQSRRSAGFGWLELLISAATEGLIWLSTRGDSERLAEQLADHHSR
ncbi:MAG: demethoxyubiquinone hydroxylase family protein [Brevundimonas sp.]